MFLLSSVYAGYKNKQTKKPIPSLFHDDVEAALWWLMGLKWNAFIVHC